MTRKLTAALLLVGIAPSGFSAPSPEGLEFFESRIRPILAQECYECHSTAGKQKGGLVLDHRDALFEGGNSGAAIVPGNGNGSLLIDAIRHVDEDLKMPKAGVKLDDAIVADFVKWIDMGAPDPRDDPPTEEEFANDTAWEAVLERRKSWWSFQPIHEPEIPPVRWSDHPVDRFLDKKIEAAGLEPAPMADPRVLGRRLSYALTGLPLTKKQLDVFEAAFRAEGPDGAMEWAIDSMLGRPQFGEKWARHWMDWIRYAETHGSEGDPSVGNAHYYRDYLIRALNADIPYDQLVREHLAGDLLKDPRVNRELNINESLIGPAHLRMVQHGFTPTDPLDERVRFTDDQINVFSQAFLGLTVSCARCHDHKFDAISQADYYALFGIFSSTRPGRVAIDLPGDTGETRKRMTELKVKIREALVRDWMAFAKNIGGQSTGGSDPVSGKIEKNSLKGLWMSLEERGVRAAEKSEVALGDEEPGIEESELEAAAMRWDLRSGEEYGRWFRQGAGLPEQVASAGEFAVAAEGGKALKGIYPSGAYSHLLSTKDGARLTSADIDLDVEYDLWLLVNGGGNAVVRYVVQNYPRKGTVYKIAHLKDGEKIDGWRWQKFDLSYWTGDSIHLELTTARDGVVELSAVDRSWFGIREARLVRKGAPAPRGDSSHLDPVIRTFKDVVGESNWATASFRNAIQRALARWGTGKLRDDEASFLGACLREGFLPNDLNQLPTAAPLVEEYRKLEATLPVATRVPGLAEWKGSDHPLFERGDHKRPAEDIPRRFLEAIDDEPYESAQSGRLELAEDLLRPDNPFTRRVIVNRVWHHLFGRGIVPTVDNFGRLGEKPTHPELLDYLALRFSEEDDWSIKGLIQFLVTSDAWQRDSRPSELARSSDPENRLWSHFPVRRLEAEAIRDSLLAVSGQLSGEMYGNPITGSAPRRSVYMRVKRNDLDPFLSAFNAPVPFATKGRRDVTNVPAQSLMLLNDPFAINASKRLATLVKQDASLTDDAARGRRLWELVLNREPTAKEEEMIAGYVERLRSRGGRMEAEMEEIGADLKGKTAERSAILDPVRDRLVEERTKAGENVERSLIVPDPVAHWEFEGDFRDSMGAMHGTKEGEVKIEDGAIVLDGGGFVSTAPLDRSLGAKTLDVLVALKTLDQAGGGAMTVQDLRGSLFDSVVFAEKDPKKWIAGSNHFRRSLSFGGEFEAEALEAPVRITIVYDEDGTIRGYRNGKPYGKPIRKADLQVFARGDTQVLFGLRHGTKASPGRSLRGRIFEARLFDRALSGEEVAALAGAEGAHVTERMVRDSLSAEARAHLDEIEGEIESLELHRETLQETAVESQEWFDLAHALINTKTF